MKTKLLAPAALVVSLGFASWSVGAASYTETSPAMKTTSVNASDTDVTKTASSRSETAAYVDKRSGEFAPNDVTRTAAPDRGFKSGWGPAPMFQLRENAGG